MLCACSSRPPSHFDISSLGTPSESAKALAPSTLRLVWTCIPEPDKSAHGLGMKVALISWRTATCLTMLLKTTVASAAVMASA